MFSFRKATPDDRFLIGELAAQVWADTYRSILSKEQLDYMFEMMYAPDNILKQMQEAHHQFFIIYKEQIPAGYLSIEPKEKDRFNFQKIYSLPQYHGSGIGRFIVEQGVAWIRSFHPEPFTVELYVNRYNPAVGFYKHIGFEEVATRDHAIGNGYFMNDYIMEMQVK